MYLHYPKCFEEYLNPEKYYILTSETDRVIVSPANDAIRPRFPVLFSRKHGNTKDALIFYVF